MQYDNRFFDDLARVAGGALGAMAGVRGELEALFRQQVERWVAELELVTRDEFEAVRAMAAQARTEQEVLGLRCAELERRLAALEQRLGGGPAPGESPPPPAESRPE